MGLNFTSQESTTLFGMLAESTSDLILKTDCRGFILDATQAISGLGSGFGSGFGSGPGNREPNMLVGPHLLDLVAPEAKETVELAHADAVAGRGTDAPVEFPATTTDGLNRWFEIRFRALRDEAGATYGTLAIMRSIEERRQLSDQLFAATYTDPLTRLTNRGACMAMLDHMLETGMDGCLALFSIDFFRAINMQHGQSTGDEVLMVFADLLREILREDDLISRIGSERFAVLLPRVPAPEAEAICRRVVATMAELKPRVGKGNLTITASASVARIAGTLDSTIERAEMALFVAKAKGRNRLEMEKPLRNAAA